MALWIDGGGGAEDKLSIAGATWRRQRPSEAGTPSVFLVGSLARPVFRPLNNGGVQFPGLLAGVLKSMAVGDLACAFYRRGVNK